MYSDVVTMCRGVDWVISKKSSSVIYLIVLASMSVCNVIWGQQRGQEFCELVIVTYYTIGVLWKGN